MYDIRLIYSLQYRLMILETKGEVVAPIVSKIENDFNCNLVFNLILEGKALPLLFHFVAN
jgi:hypothetical protein